MTLHILALETSSNVCGVALLTQADGRLRVRTLNHDATGEHAERLLPMADDLLAQAGITRNQLSAVAFGQGPGGFTGLRVACGVAQGVAFALDIPVLPVASLQAVAARDLGAGSALGPISVVVQDARMGEVYLAAYWPDADAATGWRELQEPILLDASDVGPWLRMSRPAWDAVHPSPMPIRLIGDAIAAYPMLQQLEADQTGLEVGPPLRPDAETVARLALIAWHTTGGIAPELAAPLYVRDKVAYTTLEREQGKGGNPKSQHHVSAIRPMLAVDLDHVASIEQSVQSFPWTRGNFEDGLNAGYGAWVLWLDGRIVGFCMVMFAPDVAHLLVIAVSPARQKQGVGASLLRHCEHEARARGLPAVVLEVRPSNENALDFYRRHGYTQLAIRKDYYPSGYGQREDACIMEKRLDTA